MHETDMKRRDFTRLAMAAFGGIVAGTGATAVQAEDKQAGKLTVDPALLAQAPNVCKGLNTCKGQGKGDHSCAGQSACASVEKHACQGVNACKGQGGCGGYPGQNTCKGQGHCAVPLGAETWKLARKQFEEIMKGMGKKVGPAPS